MIQAALCWDYLFMKREVDISAPRPALFLNIKDCIHVSRSLEKVALLTNQDTSCTNCLTEIFGNVSEQLCQTKHSGHKRFRAISVGFGRSNVFVRI